MELKRDCPIISGLFCLFVRAHGQLAHCNYLGTLFYEKAGDKSEKETSLVFVTY